MGRLAEHILGQSFDALERRDPPLADDLRHVMAALRMRARGKQPHLRPLGRRRRLRGEATPKERDPNHSRLGRGERGGT